MEIFVVFVVLWIRRDVGGNAHGFSFFPAKYL